MKPRTTFVLLGLALAGAAVVWFWERKLPGTAEVQERRGLVFPDLKAGQIDRLTVARERDDWEVQRKGETWNLVKPVTDRADGPAVNALIREMVSLRSSATLSPSEIQGGSAGAGFGRPGSTTIAMHAGSRSFGIEIGAEDIPGGSRFLQVKGRAEIFVVPSSLAEMAGRTVEEFRDHSLFSFTTASIREFTAVLSGAPELTFQRRPDGGWWMTRPWEDDADDSLVSSLLGQALGLQAETIIDSLNSFQVSQLAHPALTVRMKTEPPDPQTIEIAFSGELAKDSPRRLARTSIRLPAFEVDSGGLFRSLEKKPADFPTLLLLDFSPFDLLEGEISRGGKTVKVLPDNPKTDELLGLLARVEALRKAPSPAGGGLEPPAARLVLRFKDPAAHPPVTLDIGGPAGPGEVYARRSGRKDLFVIKAETAQSIDPSKIN